MERERQTTSAFDWSINQSMAQRGTSLVFMSAGEHTIDILSSVYWLNSFLGHPCSTALLDNRSEAIVYPARRNVSQLPSSSTNIFQFRAWLRCLHDRNCDWEINDRSVQGHCVGFRRTVWWWSKARQKRDDSRDRSDRRSGTSPEWNVFPVNDVPWAQARVSEWVLIDIWQESYVMSD